MKIQVLLILLFPALCPAGAAGAESWMVKMKAVNGRVSYSHTQASPVGEQSAYSGKAQVRGGGPAREIIFNSFLNQPEEGRFRLDYQAEVAGGNRARPPFQAPARTASSPLKPCAKRRRVCPAILVSAP